MPVWLQIVVAVASLILTVLGIVGFTAYWNERMKHKAQKKNKEEDKLEEKKAQELQEIEDLRHEKQKKEWADVLIQLVQPQLQSLNNKMDTMGNQMKIIADGTTDILRERILSTYYKCMDKGYRTQYDFENVEHMHKDYIGLGGNSFIADCVSKIKSLPSEEEFKAKQKVAKKARPKKAPRADNQKKEG